MLRPASGSFEICSLLTVLAIVVDVVSTTCDRPSTRTCSVTPATSNWTTRSTERAVSTTTSWMVAGLNPWNVVA